jgi:hypothetical protein
MGCSGFTSLTFRGALQAIGDAAFFNCSGLTGVVDLPETVILLGQNAFFACTSVDRFRLNRVVPIPFRSSMFRSGAVVEVPATSLDAYRSTEGWNAVELVGF